MNLLVEIEHFNQADARRVVRALNDCGVSARDEAGDDGAFEWLARRHPGGGDFCSLRAAGPVVVRDDEVSGAVMKRKGWIRQSARNSALSQRGTESTDDNLFLLAPRYYKASDERTLAPADAATGRDVYEPGRIVIEFVRFDDRDPL